MADSILIVADIIKEFMALNDNAVYIYNQDFKRNTGDLQVVIQYNSSTPYSVTNKFKPNTEGVEGATQQLRVQTKEDYTINLLSKNEDARLRKEEVLMALISQRSIDLQNQYQFSIANISSSFIDVSEVEASGALNRFAITISLITGYMKEIDAPYYDDFTIGDVKVDEL